MTFMLGRPSGVRRHGLWPHIEPGVLLRMTRRRATMRSCGRRPSRAWRTTRSPYGTPVRRGPASRYEQAALHLQGIPRSAPHLDRDGLLGLIDFSKVAMCPPDDRLRKAAMELDESMYHSFSLRQRGLLQVKHQCRGRWVSNYPYFVRGDSWT